jgi:rubrerythrin
MEKSCVHSCKGLCNALQVAEHREQEAIREYRTYASQCDYADVRTLLEDLIRDREKALAGLREKREVLHAKFAVIDKMNESLS